MVLECPADEGAEVDEAAPTSARRLLGKATDKSEPILHTPLDIIPALFERVCALSQTPATLAIGFNLLTA